jgi:hypothetical protein
MGSRLRRLFPFACATGALVAAVTAAAAPTAANLTLLLGAEERPRGLPPPIASGSTVRLETFTFVLGANIGNAGPDATAVRLRIQLPQGLRWGFDQPDPTESCTSTPTSAECVPPQPLTPGDAGWRWDVEAANPGTYTVTAQTEPLSTSDPNHSDNTATLTLVVAPRRTASPATIAPTRPRAGGLVSASTRVTYGGRAVTPTVVRCTGRAGAARIVGTAAPPRSGAAVCRYRTRRTQRGQTLRGTILLTVEGAPITRRFSVRLR